MNANELRSQLIFGLNHGWGADICESIADVMTAYQSGGLHELDERLFRLRVDLDALERAYYRNQAYLKEYRKEDAERDDDEWRMYRSASHAVGMEMQ